MKHRLKAAARELCLFLSSRLSVCVGYTHKLNTGSSPLGSMELSDFAPREVQVADAELSKVVQGHQPRAKKHTGYIYAFSVAALVYRDS